MSVIRSTLIITRNRLLLYATLSMVMWAGFFGLATSQPTTGPLLPLDDVYIHFQYARQFADGQPYQYNPGAEATSGATSLLYPLILAVGACLGFTGLWLGLWALFIGAVALFASLWALDRFFRVLIVPLWIAFPLTVSFGLLGPLAWHFFSGMETGLVIAATLWTVTTFAERYLVGFVVAASLLAVLRPETGAMAGLAVVLWVLRAALDAPTEEKRVAYSALRHLSLLLPLALIFVQPLVNQWVTGSAVSTGNQSKSILAMVPPDATVIATRIIQQFGRMWREFATGYTPIDGWYLPIVIGACGLAGLGGLLALRGQRFTGLLLVGWFLGVSLAIATLDTAFWHFKRYQMPLIALLVPLAGWTLGQLSARLGVRRMMQVYAWGVVPLMSVILLAQFATYYARNVGYVYEQPYQMALWLREHTPEEARVAVHDVGLMRYLGQRETIDIVGLTTPGAAAYWRNGPGSVAEFLLNTQPDFIASYGIGHGYGLGYLADTDLYANPVASFSVDVNPRGLVSLAADSQAIYDTRELWPRLSLDQIGDRWGYAALQGAGFTLEVADIESEAAASYQWASSNRTSFPTEVRSDDGVTSGVRLLDEIEEFTVPALDLAAGQEPILLTLVHAAHAGTIDIFANDALIRTRWIPHVPGEWALLQTSLAEVEMHDEIRIRIEPQFVEGTYQPALHVLASIPRTGAQSNAASPLATFQQGAFALHGFTMTVEAQWLSIQTTWNNAGAEGDYRLFMHLYDDQHQPPMAQIDLYPHSETQVNLHVPLGNWLSGTHTFRNRIALSDVAAGSYTVSLGFYDPNNPLDRLQPASDVLRVSADGRLWLGEVEVGGDDG